MSTSPACYDLCIAGVTLRLHCAAPLPPDPAFEPFLMQGDRPPQCTVQFCPVQQLPPLPRQELHRDVWQRMYACENGVWTRSFLDPPRSSQPYGVARCDYPGGRIRVEYLPQGAACVSQWSNSFAHVGFEGVLMQHGRVCFHAALVQTEFGGILFSGPSGIGKSTQAGLWCRHRAAVQINGDRPILARHNGVWTGWGSPYAGSSRCHVNQSCPIAAVVMLRQAPRCSIRRLPLHQAFRSIYAGLTVYTWDPAFAAGALDLAVDLAGQVPVYELSCTPDQAAVQLLEQTLRRDGCSCRT